MTTYSRQDVFSRQDVLRILQISSHQLQGWERAKLIPSLQSYSFQDLGQLRTLRVLRDESVPAALIRDSVMAMRAVAGMANPLREARVVRTGTRIAFRHCGAMVDPIRRQLIFDFESIESMDPSRPTARSAPLRMPCADPGARARDIADLFLAAVQAEEAGNKQRAMDLYEEIVAADSTYAAAYINLGTLHFHLRQFERAEELYRRATEADPSYVLAFFDLGNVLDELLQLDESIVAYKQAIALSPQYADAHYNLALAYEHKGEPRRALSHWQTYLRLDRSGPWAEHARVRIHQLLKREKLTIASRTEAYRPASRGCALLALVMPQTA